MGLINNDSYETPFGTSLTGTYIAIANNGINIARGHDEYVLEYRATVWTDHDARTSNKKSISMHMYTVTLTAEQLGQNVYSTAYADLKTKYPNTTDV